MGTLIFILFILVMLLCFCIYNCWDLREKNKRMFEHEKKKISTFNSYKAWAVYAIVVFLVIITIAGYYIYGLMETIINTKV